MSAAEERDDKEAPREAAENGIDALHAFLKRQAEERPLALVGAALGAGLLLGCLLSRGRR